MKIISSILIWLLLVSAGFAAMPYGYARLDTHGWYDAAERNFGYQSNVSTDTTGMTWDDANKEFDIEETGKYEAVMLAAITHYSGTANLINLRIRVDGEEKNRISPMCHSANDPQIRRISWVGTINSGSSITATRNGQVGNGIQFRIGSTFIVRRIY